MLLLCYCFEEQNQSAPIFRKSYYITKIPTKLFDTALRWNSVDKMIISCAVKMQIESHHQIAKAFYYIPLQFKLIKVHYYLIISIMKYFDLPVKKLYIIFLKTFLHNKLLSCPNPVSNFKVGKLTFVKF